MLIFRRIAQGVAVFGESKYTGELLCMKLEYLPAYLRCNAPLLDCRKWRPETELHTVQTRAWDGFSNSTQLIRNIIALSCCQS